MYNIHYRVIYIYIYRYMFINKHICLFLLPYTRQTAIRARRGWGVPGWVAGWVARWVARWVAGPVGSAGRDAGDWRPTREQTYTHTQTHKHTNFSPQPKPIPKRTQGSKEAARAPPHPDKIQDMRTRDCEIVSMRYEI